MLLTQKTLLTIHLGSVMYTTELKKNMNTELH